MPVATHIYRADLTARPDHRGRRPCRDCPLPEANRVHQVPDTADAQAEQLRRIGGDQ